MNLLNKKNFIPHVVAVAAILLMNVIYFLPQLSGKTIPMGDIVQYQKMVKEAQDFNSANPDNPTLWTNSMFGGMPTFQLNAPATGNKLPLIDRILSLGFNRPLGYFIAGSILFYISLLLMGVSPWVSLVMSLFFGLCSNNIILYEAGHTSKIKVIQTVAPIIASIIAIYRGKLIPGLVVFGLAFGLNLTFNHLQITYYLALFMVPLVFLLVVMLIKEGKIAYMLKAIPLLLIVTALGLGSSASRLMTTLEFSKYTLRGPQILSPRDSTGKVNTSVAKTQGLDYEYAMQWSNGLGDVLAGLVPRIVGGGSSEKISKSTEVVKALGRNEDTVLPTYHGSLPFTSGPVYFGIVAVFLAVMGLFLKRDAISWWLVGSLLVSLLMSMGKNFGILNEALFEYLPSYNKFRAHTAVTGISSIFILILAGLGVQKMIDAEDKNSLLKPLKISGIALGVFLIGLWLVGDQFMEFTSASDEQLGDARTREIIIAGRIEIMKASALRCLLLVISTAVALFFYTKGKLNQVAFIAVIGLLGALDLWSVDRNYINKESFVREGSLVDSFQPRAVDTQILQDKDPNFRVYDASINTFNSADASYFHKTIGGYNPAKLRRIQDVIEQHISKNNMRVINMLNTKYFIVPGQNNQPMVQPNPEALGNAWFVSNIKLVNSADAETDSLAKFNPAETAIVHEEFKAAVDGLKPVKNGSIKLSAYQPNKLVYNTESTSEQLAVFSEVWYGPNLGWQASIDGKPVDHIRANYILRGLKVPAGKHEIVFEFKPATYYRGEAISKWSSLGLIGLSLVGLGLLFFKKK
jgi:hypothetical protein